MLAGGELRQPDHALLLPPGKALGFGRGVVAWQWVKVHGRLSTLVPTFIPLLGHVQGYLCQLPGLTKEFGGTCQLHVIAEGSGGPTGSPTASPTQDTLHGMRPGTAMPDLAAIQTPTCAANESCADASGKFTGCTCPQSAPACNLHTGAW